MISQELTIKVASTCILTPVAGSNQTSSKYQCLEQHQNQQVCQIQTQNLQHKNENSMDLIDFNNWEKNSYKMMNSK